MTKKKSRMGKLLDREIAILERCFSGKAKPADLKFYKRFKVFCPNVKPLPKQ